MNQCQRKKCVDNVDKAYDGICRCDCDSKPILEICGADNLLYRNPCAL